MPRRPRLEIAGLPLHVTHRGVNRAAVFLDDDDFLHYRSQLDESLAAHGVALHAYVLMTNHVHLLVTPSALGALSRAMCRLGQRYVPAFNRKHGRTGTLWEGRFKSCLVDTDRYLLTVYRYIERNPVRVALAELPEQYRWSSARTNLGLDTDPAITPHAGFLALGDSPHARAISYRPWLHAGLGAEELNAIRMHLQQERALGSPRFQAMAAKTLNREVSCRPRGRPAVSRPSEG